MHKAVTPAEAARVDKVDAFFEVLFAREESNREGSFFWGELSQEWSPPLHLQTARDSQPWVLSAASVYSEWGHSLGRGQAAQQAEREAAPTSPVGTRNKD